MEKINVVHIGAKNYPPAHGGVEKFVFDIVKFLPKINSSVLVEWEQQETNSVKVLPKGFFRQVSFISKYVKDNNCEVLHFNKETFIPHALCFSFLLKKTMLTIHGCAWRIKRWAWYYRMLFYLLDLLACICVKRVVFVGENDYKHFSKIIFWKTLYYIPNGIEDNELIASSDVSKCVYIGRISPEKNIKGLLEMFKDTPYNLTLFGPFDKHQPSYKKEILKIVGSMENVIYGGVLNFDEIFQKLSKYNTFCNLSFSEGMPVSVLEAASVGLNLVLSDIPQHRDLGFTDVIYVNPQKTNVKFKFKSKSVANKNKALKEFSLKTTASKYFDLYKTLL